MEGLGQANENLIAVPKTLDKNSGPTEGNLLKMEGNCGEVSGNHSGETFSAVTAKDWGLEAPKIVPYKKINELAQSTEKLKRKRLWS